MARNRIEITIVWDTVLDENTALIPIRERLVGINYRELKARVMQPYEDNIKLGPQPKPKDPRIFQGTVPEFFDKAIEDQKRNNCIHNYVHNATREGVNIHTEGERGYTNHWVCTKCGDVKSTVKEYERGSQ